MYLLSDDGDDPSVTKNNLFKRVHDEETQSGSMIESVYGVEERRHQPQKRIKADDGHAMSFNGSVKERLPRGEITGLSEYMKEGSGDAPPPPTTPGVDMPGVDTIDLTTIGEFIRKEYKPCAYINVCYRKRREKR